MVYREPVLCAYCDGLEAARCSRCGCRLCEAHRSAVEQGWCWACAKELKDELDVEAFRTMVNTPEERYVSGNAVEAWTLIAGWIASRNQRRARAKVLERNREQIEAWRRGAGIRTRW